MSALLLELQSRGHRITWIGVPDGQSLVEPWGFDSVIVGEDVFPLGYMASAKAQLGKLTGWAAVRFTVEQYQRAIEVGLRDMPRVLRQTQADLILADESAFHVRSLADQLDMPWVSVASALPMHPDPDLPPAGLPWAYGRSVYHRMRNRVGRSMVRLVMRKIFRAIADYRSEHGLSQYDFLQGNASRLATLAQITRKFDFPRREISDWFHYVGSLHQADHRPAVPFPFDQLDTRPLIYASMGTLQNRLHGVFYDIAVACADVDCQLVVSLGGGCQPSDVGDLPGQPMVVEYAPQLELIKRASLVVTHAGMNTVTESIAAGVPMLAIPVTNDQPAIGARIARAGCGLTIPVHRASPRNIRAAVNRLLSDARVQQKAREQAVANADAGGLRRAIQIVERCL